MTAFLEDAEFTWKRFMKKFTLIELLVVVAIIGILASILLPSLSKARERGKRAVCKSNIKQIGLSMTMYSDDNDSLLPRSTDWATTIMDTGQGYRQMGYFFPYMEIVDIYYCPSMPNTNIGGYNFSKTVNKKRWEDGGEWVQASYSYRKYANPETYNISNFDSSTAMITDAHHELWSDRFGLFTHGPEGYNTMYGDTSIKWVRDPTQYCINTAWSNVAISLNDTAVWNVLFDRD